MSSLRRPVPYPDGFDHQFTLNHDLHRYFADLVLAKSSRALAKMPLYQQLKEDIDGLLGSYEYGFFDHLCPDPNQKFYRAVCWNIERGICFEGICDALQNHPQLKSADFIYLIESDIGMARSYNRNVAAELALKLKMNYFFAPAYLNLSKGNFAEKHYEGSNQLGLHGNAFLSKFPIENLRVKAFENSIDIMKGQEKRLGKQQALIADVSLKKGEKVTIVALHLDPFSSPQQRQEQMDTVLSVLEDNAYPILIAGDFNTSTMNAKKLWMTVIAFLKKVYRGMDHIISTELLHPDQYDDHFLFDLLKEKGFHYQALNQPGAETLRYTIDDFKGDQIVRSIVPESLRRLAQKKLKRHGGGCGLKLDWFVGKSIVEASSHVPQALSPRVIKGLTYQNQPLSDHDPIILDFNLQ